MYRRGYPGKFVYKRIQGQICIKVYTYPLVFSAHQPGHQWARAAIDIRSHLVSRQNEVEVRWIPAHAGVTGNEMADQYAKEAMSGQRYGVPDELRWEASLSHLSQVATETRSGATSRWISEHVRPERRYRPPAQASEGMHYDRSGSHWPAGISVRTRSDRLLSPREDDGPSQQGVSQVPVVQVRQEVVATSSFRRV